MGTALSHQQRLHTLFRLVAGAHDHPCALLDTAHLGHSSSNRHRFWDISSIPEGKVTLGKSLSRELNQGLGRVVIGFYSTRSMMQTEVRAGREKSWNTALGRKWDEARLRMQPPAEVTEDVTDFPLAHTQSLR